MAGRRSRKYGKKSKRTRKAVYKRQTKRMVKKRGKRTRKLKGGNDYINIPNQGLVKNNVFVKKDTTGNYIKDIIKELNEISVNEQYKDKARTQAQDILEKYTIKNRIPKLQKQKELIDAYTELSMSEDMMIEPYEIDPYYYLPESKNAIYAATAAGYDTGRNYMGPNEDEDEDD